MTKNNTNGTLSKSKIVRQVRSKDFAIKRSVQVGVPTGSVDTGRAANFITLASVADSTDFTSLFDQFTYDSIDVHFVCTRAAISAGNSAIFPTLLFAVDQNDSVAPSTINDVLSYEGCRLFQFSETNRHCVFTFTPKTNQTLASGSAVSAGPLWCSTGSAATAPWYGYKYWLVDYNSTSTAGSVITMYLTYHMRFRVPK